MGSRAPKHYGKNARARRLLSDEFTPAMNKEYPQESETPPSTVHRYKQICRARQLNAGSCFGLQ
jgi:hypothetical protein